MTLSAHQIAGMRTLANRYMPDTCTIQRATVTQDGMGGISETWADLAANVACRMDEPKASAQEAAVNMEVGAVVTRIMHLKYDQDITIKDRVVYGGLTYEVAEVQEAATWLITRRVLVKRVE